MVEKGEGLGFFHQAQTFRVLAQRSKHVEIARDERGCEASFSKNRFRVGAGVVLCAY